MRCNKLIKNLAKLSPKAGRLLALGDEITHKQLKRLEGIQRKQNRLIKQMRKKGCKL